MAPTRASRGLALAAVLLVAGSALAQQAPEPTIQVLDNGLTVIVQEQHASPVVAVRFLVGTGSAYEGRYLGAGLSHLVEHAIDGGTPTRSRTDIQKLIESIGNASNAMTEYDTTQYYITTSAPCWSQALEVLADYVLHPTFPEEIVQQEQGVIRREMAMSDDNPADRAWDLALETVFLVDSSRHRILGYPALFDALTRDDLVAYHQDRYVPENVTIVVAGDVTTADVIDRTRELLGSLPRRALKAVARESEPPQTAPRRRTIVDPDLDTAYLIMAYRSIDLLHPDLYALDVLSYVLSQGASSRLVRTLRDEQSLVSHIETHSYTPPRRPGVFAVEAMVDPANLVPAEAAIADELLRCQTEEVTPEELDRAKAQKSAELVFARETVEGLASQLAFDYYATGDVRFSERYVEGIRRVTAEDVKRVAATYLRPEALCVALLTPTESEASQEAVGAPSAAPVQKVTLDNGLTLLLGEDHAVPMVSVVSATLGGLRAETRENNGICSLTAQTMLRGTASRSRVQIARALEDVGGHLEVSSGRNSITVTATVLAQNLDTALDTVGDVLQHATFPEQELAAEKQQALEGLAQEQDDAFAASERLFLPYVYTRHPYGMEPSGTPESVGGLTREAVVSLYDQLVRPERTVLALYGDFDATAARAAVEKAFAGWARGDHAFVAPEPERPLAELRSATLTRPQGQTMVMFGFPGPRLADDDFYVREVLDAMLSGKGLPGGPLHNTLRERGLVYMVHAWSADGLEPGHFTIVAATAPETADQAKAAIEEVVMNFLSTVPSESDLAAGKQMCIAEHTLSLQQLSSRAQEAALNELYGLGFDRSAHYAERIQEVTADDILRVGRQLLDLKHCVTVVVGPERAAPAP
ncbi:MAG TPA: pitrilysin family protein [Armatimonadota bacterium]|nr:pitrilysin family protein [Armatimonadota bacterium]